jgi:hypothetical protein
MCTAQFVNVRSMIFLGFAAGLRISYASDSRVAVSSGRQYLPEIMQGPLPTHNVQVDFPVRCSNLIPAAKACVQHHHTGGAYGSASHVCVGGSCKAAHGG